MFTNCVKCGRADNGDDLLTPEGFCFDCDQGPAEGEIRVGALKDVVDNIVRGIAQKVNSTVKTAHRRFRDAVLSWKQAPPT